MSFDRMVTTKALFMALALVIGFTGIARAEGDGHDGHGAHGMSEKAASRPAKAEPMEHEMGEMMRQKMTGDAYPLDTCIVSGEKLGGEMGDPIQYTHEGRDIKFCCKGCVSMFEKDSAKYIEKLDAAIIEQQKGSYPLKTCLVTGEKLGGMGEPVMHVSNNRLIEFCCGGCVSKFEKEPAKFTAMLDAAVIEQQKANYPLKTCVVSGDPLPAEPVMMVSGNRLIELASPECKAMFNANPAKYTAKLDEAAKTQNADSMQ